MSAPPGPGRRRLGPLLVLLLAVVTAGSANAESASIGASVLVAPIEVELALSAASARVGDKVGAEASVTNLGSSPLVGISLELRVDAAGLGIRGSSVTTIARLRPGGSASSTWTLCALEAGNYVLLARATTAGGVAVDSVARILSVSGARRRAC